MILSSGHHHHHHHDLIVNITFMTSSLSYHHHHDIITTSWHHRRQNWEGGAGVGRELGQGRQAPFRPYGVHSEGAAVEQTGGEPMVHFRWPPWSPQVGRPWEPGEHGRRSSPGWRDEVGGRPAEAGEAAAARPVRRRGWRGRQMQATEGAQPQAAERTCWGASLPAAAD